MLMPLAEPESIEKVLERVGFSPDLVVFALVNGEKADLSLIVKDGDEVVLVSPLMGG